MNVLNAGVQKTTQPHVIVIGFDSAPDDQFNMIKYHSQRILELVAVIPFNSRSVVAKQINGEPEKKRRKKNSKCSNKRNGL